MVFGAIKAFLPPEVPTDGLVDAYAQSMWPLDVFTVTSADLVRARTMDDERKRMAEKDPLASKLERRAAALPLLHAQGGGARWAACKRRPRHGQRPHGDALARGAGGAATGDA